MPSIQITADWIVTSHLKDAIKDVKNGFEKAMYSSVKRTAREMRTWASKKIRDEIAIKKKHLDPYINIPLQPTRKNPTARITVRKSNRIPLKYFGLKQKYKQDRNTGWHKGAGLSYKISKKKGRQVFKKGFGAEEQIWTTLRGHGFVRSGKKRLPIVKLHGPSAWGVFKLKGRPAQWELYGKTRLRENLEHEVSYRIKKAQGKA